MKRIFFQLMLVCVPLLLNAATEPGWTTDYDTAVRTATKAMHPLLLDFSATWCGPCQMMARTTLLDSNVAQKLGSFIAVKVDIDANTLLAEHFGVHAVPTFVALDSRGEEIERLTGATDAANFSAWLNRALSAAAFSTVRRESFEQESKTLADELRSSDPNAKSKSVETLLDYSFRKEKYYRDFAEANLKTAARSNPAVFLDFLNDKKLAIRILAANLLRDQLGPSFDFDPWARAAVRTVIIDKWRSSVSLEHGQR